MLGKKHIYGPLPRIDEWTAHATFYGVLLQPTLGMVGFEQVRASWECFDRRATNVNWEMTIL